MANAPSLRDLMARGFRVFPLHLTEKRPLVTGWQALASSDPDDFDVWDAEFPGGYRLGIATGPESGVWVLDVDDKGALTDLFEERGGGEFEADACVRTPSGGLHFYFSWPTDGGPVPTRKGCPTKGLDVRGSGGLVAAPDGEGYVWAVPPSGDLPQAPAWLLAAVRAGAAPTKLGTTADLPFDVESLPESHFDPELHADLQDALRFLGARGWADNYDSWTRVGMALHSFPSVREGFLLWDGWSQRADSYEGPHAVWDKWHQLEPTGGLTYSSIFHWAQELGWGNPGARPEQSPNQPLNEAELSRDKNLREELEVLAKAEPPFPMHLLDDAGGLMGAFAEWVLASSLYPQPVLALGAALSLAGVVYGRKYRTESDSRTNFLIAGLAASGSGKERARKCLGKLLYEGGAFHLLGASDFASGAAIRKALSIQPAQLFLLDEFGDLLQAMTSNRAPAHVAQIVKAMKEVESSAGGHLAGTAYASDERDRTDVEDPHMVVYATTTLQSFTSALTSERVLDGFLNRWLLLRGQDDVKRARVPASALDVPTSLVEMLQAHLAAGQPSGDLVRATKGSKARVVPEDPEVMDRMEALDDELAGRVKGNEVRRAAWRRMPYQAHRLALAHAVSLNPERPRITMQSFEWGLGLATWSTELMWGYLSAYVADSPFETSCKVVLRVLRHAGERGLTTMELSRERGVRSLQPRVKKDVLAALVEQGLAYSEQEETGGRPATRYRSSLYRGAVSSETD